MLNLRPIQLDDACDGRRYRVMASYLSKDANFNLLHLHLAPQLGVTPYEFCQDLPHQKTSPYRLPCGVACVILRLAVSVEHQLVTYRQTDRQTDTRLRHMPHCVAWQKSVAIWQSHRQKYSGTFFGHRVCPGLSMKPMLSARAISIVASCVISGHV